MFEPRVLLFSVFFPTLNLQIKSRHGPTCMQSSTQEVETGRLWVGDQYRFRSENLSQNTNNTIILLIN